MQTDALRVQDLKKLYHRGQEDVHAVDGVSLSIGQGEFVAVTGASGSGKSTLLYLMGCMDSPSSGQVFVNGSEASGLPESGLAKLRQDHFGFVFQGFFLMPTLTALENVQMPTAFSGRQGDPKRLLKLVGLEGRENHLPSQLSGGEMQRVAIARALVNEPKVILADEPTGNLDSKNAVSIFELLSSLSKEHGLTVVVVTHNDELASRADRVVRLRDGKIQDQESKE